MNKNIVTLYSCCSPPLCCAKMDLDFIDRFAYIKDDYNNIAKVPFNEMKILAEQFLEKIDE